MEDEHYPILGTGDADAGFPDIDVGPVVKAFPDIDVGGTIRLERAGLAATHTRGDEFAVALLPARGEGALRLAGGTDVDLPDSLDDLVREDSAAVGALGCRVLEVEERTLLVQVTDLRMRETTDGAADHEP